MAVGDEIKKNTPRTLVDNGQYRITIECENDKTYRIKSQVVPAQYGKKFNDNSANWLADFEVEGPGETYNLVVRKLGSAPGTTVVIGKEGNATYRTGSFNGDNVCTIALAPGDPSIGIR